LKIKYIIGLKTTSSFINQGGKGGEEDRVCFPGKKALATLSCLLELVQWQTWKPSKHLGVEEVF